MATGTLKAWIEDRGFGFLKPSDGGEDVFFHATSLLGSGINPDDLRKGDLLSFDVGRGRDGRTAAENVRWAEHFGRLYPIELEGRSLSGAVLAAKRETLRIADMF